MHLTWTNSDTLIIVAIFIFVKGAYLNWTSLEIEEKGEIEFSLQAFINDK